MVANAEDFQIIEPLLWIIAAVRKNNERKTKAPGKATHAQRAVRYISGLDAVYNAGPRLTP